MSAIGRVLSQGIREGHWVLIDYRNQKEDRTVYWIASWTSFPSREKAI